MRYSFSGSIDAASRKYGYEYIKSASLKQAILPLLASVVYFVLFFTDVVLRFSFLGVFAVSLVLCIIQCTKRYTFGVKPSMIFMGIYNFLCCSVLSAGVVFTILSMFVGLNYPALIVDSVLAVVLIINIAVLLVNVIRSFKYEAILRATGNCRLDIYDDKIAGVALDEKNRNIEFEEKFEDISVIYTMDEDLNKKSHQKILVALNTGKDVVISIKNSDKALYNILIVMNDRREIRLALSQYIAAREELKYVIKSLNDGKKPFPKEACGTCGFYLIEGRCPNCDRVKA